MCSSPGRDHPTGQQSRQKSGQVGWSSDQDLKISSIPTFYLDRGADKILIPTFIKIGECLQDLSCPWLQCTARHEILSLKVPNVEFDFGVSVDIIQLQTDTSKSNWMLVSKLWVLIIARKWVCYVFDVCVRSCILSTDADISKTLHRSRIRHLVLSVICVYDLYSCMVVNFLTRK